MPKEQVAEAIIERVHDMLEPNDDYETPAAADQTLLMPKVTK